MSEAQDHYKNFQAKHYTWMFGTPFATKVAEQKTILDEHASRLRIASTSVSLRILVVDQDFKRLHLLGSEDAVDELLRSVVDTLIPGGNSTASNNQSGSINHRRKA